MSETPKNPIEYLFEMFSQGAMKPRPYMPKNMPLTVTVTIKPETMELLHVISCRIGTTRANVAAHILQIGAVQAAAGCGFTVGEDEKIPDSEKKWDVAHKTMGFYHVPENEEAA
jgi:hypothetical protein